MQIETQSSLIFVIAAMFFGSPVAIVWLIVSYKKWKARLEKTGCVGCADSDTGVCIDHIDS